MHLWSWAVIHDSFRFPAFFGQGFENLKAAAGAQNDDVADVRNGD